VVFNTGPYTVLPDNSILITANMQSVTGFSSSHQLKSYIASKSSLKLAARAVLSADAGLLVLAYSQLSHIRYIPYFRTWYDLSANLQYGSLYRCIDKALDNWRLTQPFTD